MARLTARFDVDLPGELLISWPNGDPIVFGPVILDEFEVAIEFDTESAASRKEPQKTEASYSFQNVTVLVSRNELEAPPRIKEDENGGRDFSEVRIYLDERREEYGEVAWRITNRVIRYFKYVLRTPELYEILRRHDSFRNATWTDDSGYDYKHGGTVFGTQAIPGEGFKLGRQILNRESKESFLRALEQPITPSLGDDILSDAQTALYKKDLRRAILEMAIGSEIAVKRKYFAGESPAGSAFDYLEDKSRVHVRVLDLIDAIALEAFGKSFRQEQSTAFRNIDYLFRCRNKIAHRGELSFRNDAADWVEVDSKLVTDWWNSVSVLLDWIDDL